MFEALSRLLPPSGPPDAGPATPQRLALRAAVSSATVVAALKRDATLVDVLFSHPAVAAAVATRPGAFATAGHAVKFLRDKELLSQLEGQPGLLDVVLGHRHVLDAVLRNQAVVRAMAADPELPRLLGERPDIARLLGGSPRMAEVLGRSKALRRAFDVVSGLAQAVTDKPAIGQALQRAPELADALLRVRSLVGEARDDTVLWRAVVAAPRLAQAVNVRMARVLGHDRSGLLAAIVEQPGLVAQVTVGDLRRLLSNPALTRFLTRHPHAVAPVLNVPRLREAVLHRPEFTAALRGLENELPEAVNEERLLGVLAGVEAPIAAPAAPRRRDVPLPEAAVRPERGVAVSAPADVAATGRDRVPRVDAAQIWADALASQPETAELVLGAEHAEMGAELDRYPELLALLLHSSTADEVRADPGRWRDYAFGAFLEAGGGELRVFEADFEAYLNRLALVLTAEQRGPVSREAHDTWNRVLSEKEERKAQEREAVARRWQEFNPGDPDTWHYSGRYVLSHPSRLEPLLTEEDHAVLRNLALGHVQPREPREAVGLHKALHAHIRQGGGGVSFTFAADKNAEVILVVHAVATHRVGNTYDWQNSGGQRPSARPVGVEVAARHPAVQASFDLVEAAAERRAAASSGSASEGKGKGKGKARAANSDGTKPAGSRTGAAPVGDRGLKALAGAIAEYQRARSAATADAVPALEAARGRLLSLGLDPDVLGQVGDDMYGLVPEPGDSRPGTANLSARASASRATDTDVPPPVDYALILDQDRPEVVESRPGETLWRFSSHPPEEVFTIGFPSDDTDNLVDIRKWVQRNPKAQFVSTTRDPELWHAEKRFRYEIYPWRNFDPTGVDVVYTLERRYLYPFEHELEVAFTGRIDPAAVVRVLERSTGMIGTWDGEAVVWHDRYSWMPRLPQQERTVVEFAEGEESLSYPAMETVAAIAERAVADMLEGPYYGTTGVHLSITGYGDGADFQGGAQEEYIGDLRANAVAVFLEDRIRGELATAGEAAAGIAVQDFVITVANRGNHADPALAGSGSERREHPRSVVVEARPFTGRNVDSDEDSGTEADVAPGVRYGLMSQGDAAPPEAGQTLGEQGPGRGETTATGSGRVVTGRWRRVPGAAGFEPFEFESGPGPADVRMVKKTGELTEVGYDWEWLDAGGDSPAILHMTRRIHLSARDGVTANDLQRVRQGLAQGVDSYLNEPGFRLPAGPLAEGDREPGPLLRVAVEFVEDPEAAHGQVVVEPGLPTRERGMNQSRWFSKVHPVAYVHEFVHGLGVHDDPSALPLHGSLMGRLYGEDPSVFTLTDRHLTQIA
ncbi:hypothetical protein ABZV75_39960, partial [Streptomyces flaveolus]|uniref:scabin-related ADP-ribosyltransferase n=1 Tax=Streptomyces flaveolus TaxID=67297 RepID=UPI003472256B